MAIKNFSKNLYNTLQEAIPEVLIVIKPNLEIITINKQFTKLFPSIPLPENGYNITDVFKDTFYSPLVSQFRRAINTGNIITEQKIRTHDGTNRIIEFRSKEYSDGFICLLKDITEYYEMSSALEKKILKYKNFIEMLPAMVCETDQDGIITFASNMAMEHMGYNHTDIQQGLHLFSLLSEPDIALARRNLNKIRQGHKLPPREYTLKTKNGKQFPAIVQVESIMDEDNTVIGFRGKLEDLSEIKRIEKEFKEAKAKAEQLSKTKSDFLTNFSHEIKTPINAIIGLSNCLVKRIHDPTQLSQLKTIRKSGNILLSLLNDILDLSKIEAGKWELYNEPVDVHELLMDISETFSFTIEEKGLIYYSNIGAEVPKYLMMDGIKLRQVLFNIVGNAVKFTDKGHISVNLETVKLKNEYDLIISVEDSGYGIPKAQQRLIFEAFEQGVKQRKTQGGSGLGLAISKRIIQMMNGDIQLKSQLFKGSTFIITIPSVKEVEIGYTDMVNQQNRSCKYFPDFSVLIVDDIYTNIETLEAYLLNYNCKIQSVQKVNDAFRALEKPELPDLIFMDIFIPEISGIEASRHIKKQPHLKHIPIIAYSANTHHLKESERKFFDDFLLKPIKESTLLEILEKYSSQTKTGIAILPDNLEGIDAKLKATLKNKLTKKWEAINEYFINNDIKDFANQLVQIAEKHNHQQLVLYSKNLLTHINAFNISEVERELEKLSPVFTD